MLAATPTTRCAARTPAATTGVAVRTPAACSRPLVAGGARRVSRKTLCHAVTSAAVADSPAPPRTTPDWLRRLSLARSPPWASVQDGSVLSVELGGALPETAPPAGPLSGAPVLSLPAFTEALRKAAVDPRITGVYLKVSPLACGWAKLSEVRRAIALFRATAPTKFTMAYMELASEREYYIACACEEVYIPESAYVSLRGLSVSGTFLRGVLEKVGIEPQIKRIGIYKSAGDQLGRSSMSDAQREVLTSLLSQIYEEWTTGVAASRGKTVDDVTALLEAPAPQLTPTELAAQGWITGTLYADEVKAHLAARTRGSASEICSVTVARYMRTRPQKLGLDLGAPSVAVIRASGAISRGRTSTSPLSRGGGGITNETFIAQLQRVKKDKRIKALVLRIDSPGGDALASDLMWRELRTLGKPVIASLSDVAASGGYFMCMACDRTISEKLTLTGSIGVITGKFNLEKLYERIGFNKEIISKGRFSQVDADNRSFTADEEAFFDAGAWAAYTSFRDKAALSRGIQPEEMEKFAQGRVWTGQQALERGLVDALGGFNDAVTAAKLAAGMKADDPVSLVDFSGGPSGFQALFQGALALSPLALLSTAASASSLPPQPQAAMEALSLGGFTAGTPPPDVLVLGALKGLLGEDAWTSVTAAGGDAAHDPLQA